MGQYTQNGLSFAGAAPSIYPATAITKSAFRNRFAFTERVAIKTAEASNPMLRVLADDQANATFIDLARQDTAAGLDLLVSLSLITAARKKEILTNPIGDIERPL